MSELTSAERVRRVLRRQEPDRLPHFEWIIAARSGREGIGLAGQIQPDLIVLDIQLPEMDGYTVARALRQNPSLKNVPIVAVTSYAMVGDREKALAAGCTGYIEKPINPETFVASITRHLSALPGGNKP